MLPATTQMGGLCSAFPDTCHTPFVLGAVVQIPYTNTSQPTLAVNTSPKVFVLGMPAVTLASTIPLSTGDEPGTGGGVKSGVIMGPTKFTKGSSNVFVGGVPWVHQTSMTQQNGVVPNCDGAVVAPSQSKVFVRP